MKLTLKITSLIIISAFFVSCSSKQKAAMPAAGAAKTTTATKDSKANGKAVAAKSQAAATGATVCKSGSDARTLEVIKKDSGCELAYTKFNETTTPANSANGTAHCDSVKERIKTNLENAGFKCE